MKKIVLLLFCVIYSNQIQAQNSVVFDSLRYYPNVKEVKFAFETNGIPFDGEFLFQSENEELKVYNGFFFREIVGFIFDYDQAIPLGESYERIDSTTGFVYRSLESLKKGSPNFEGPLSVTTVFGDEYEPKTTMSKLFKDSLAFPIERLFYEVQPQKGDTVLLGSARFAGSNIESRAIDSIDSKDIVLLFKGYRELSDRDLGFDNSTDSLIKLIDFEIRYSWSNDSLLTYTLAKDIGLLEVTVTSKSSNSNVSIHKAQLYDTEVNGRIFTRLGLYVSNEKQQEKPNSFQIQAFPNPFNPTTTIRYQLTKSGETSIQVFDVLGRLVQTLEDGFKTVGSHTVRFNANSLTSGLYLIQIKSQDAIQIEKVVLVK